MSSLKNMRRVIVALTVTLFLAACSGGNSAQGSGQGAQTDGSPRRGGTLVFIAGAEPRSLDPAAMSNNWGVHAAVGNALFGTLISKVSETNEVTEGMAKSLKTKDGGVHWTLTLPDGLTFSDGSPLDGDAVAFNWNRHRDPKVGSASKAAGEMIDSMKADGQVLEFTLAQASPYFAQAIMDSGLNWIASPKALEKGAAFNDAPIAAGPFVMKSWARGDKLVLARNEKYHAPEKPYLDGVTFRFNPDEATRVATVQSGGAQMTNLISPAFAAQAEEAGLVLPEQKLNGGNVLALNSRIPPFDDPRAREALVKAVDLDALNEAVYLGKAEMPHTLFAEGSPFYTGGTKLTGFDRTAAQRLFDELAAAGKPVDFTITTFSSSETKKVSESIQAQLSAYKNVTVKVEPLDSAAALAKLADHSFQAMPNGFAFADPEPLVYQSLYSKSSGNRAGITDPGLDAALLRGRESTNIADRRQAYSDVATRVAELNPGLFYVRAPRPVAAAPSVHGIRTYGQSSVVFDDLWLNA